MVLPGIVIGLIGAIALGKLISAQLFGVQATDPFVLGSTTLVLGGTALLACLVPSLQASRVAPMEALRDE